MRKSLLHLFFTTALAMLIMPWSTAARYPARAPCPEKSARSDCRYNGSRLDQVRAAAATTLMAEKLFDFSKRTGQTRFLVDGNKIIDISGYRPQLHK